MFKARECRHIMPSGRNCQSPAITGSVYCCHHGLQNTRSSRIRAGDQAFELPVIAEPSDIVGAINHILDALSSNRISSRRAAVLLNAVQMLQTNFDAVPYRPQWQ